jgi:chloramphenicol-sensitive protein RarD
VSVNSRPDPTAVQLGPGISRSGLSFAISAYLLWGVLPLYFLLLIPTGPFEIVAWRVLLSLVFCALLLTVIRAWPAFLALVRDRRVLFTMALAGALIYLNWQTYVYAATSGQVVEASLGYFINPIVTVFLGVIVLRERLNVTQWVAVGISILAVLVLAIGQGFPWIALTLAFSFGFYGLIKKRVGPRVDAVSGLTLETAWLTPVAAVQLWLVAEFGGGITMGQHGPWHTAMLLLAGAITAVPLLLFAAASRRLPLTVLGFIQYFAPFIQFLVGVLVLGEHMSLQRWIGFGLVWIALVVLTVDLVRRARTTRRTAAVEPPAATGGCEPV